MACSSWYFLSNPRLGMTTNFAFLLVKMRFLQQKTRISLVRPVLTGWCVIVHDLFFLCCPLRSRRRIRHSLSHITLTIHWLLFLSLVLMPLLCNKTFALSLVYSFYSSFLVLVVLGCTYTTDNYIKMSHS